ncbi:MAG: exodeoxyribonuclease V subunit beta [Deltaproteobacteria bacterium]|nr:exodeoxyribonuclease V subunit beta [Deltaproteobacteria bacterium]
MALFDLLSCPLEGRNLLEASAGTGKTYALAGLYLRLLLEKGLPLGRILVVTFTEAATGELRDRIRRRIREALRAFSGEAAPADELLLALLERSPDRHRAAGLLAAALAQVDEAAIFTIHGCCARALSESAFECGSSAEAELVPDASELLREVAEDFWRSRLLGESADFLAYVLETQREEFGPEGLARLLRTASRKPEISILPEDAGSETAGVEESYREAFDRVRRVWAEGETEVCRILLEDPRLKRQTYAKRFVPSWLDQLREYLCTGTPQARFDNFKRFCASDLAAATKDGSPPPDHPFFHACEELRSALEALRGAYDRKILALKAECLRWAGEELRRRKRERSVRSYDDLLLDLKRALEAPGGSEVAGRLRKRYGAALVDEFQDTDGVQYAIFRRAFSEETALFLIGDPKQAIYGFRGADVFTYVAAAREAGARYTLGVNWRSSSRLVAAVNALFEGRPRPFHLSEIPFEPVEAAARPGEAELELDGSPDPAPLKLWLLERAEGEKPLGTGEGTGLVAEAVADEIARLLNAGRAGRARIDGRPVAPADVAVLVRSNRQASLVQGVLGTRGVPSVLQSTGSLFESREAEEVFRLLRALAEPGNEGRVKAALLTDLFGVGGDGLARLLADEDTWTGRLQGFREYHELWVEKGLLAASRVLLAREGVRERLLPLPDGERRLTNLLHCFEALHRESVAEKRGPEQLIVWLARRLRESSDAEEHQLRLETDAEAMRVVTIHRSKGLEYPIVFCPYCWSPPREERGPVSFHRGEAERTEFLDLGSDEIETHRRLAREELLAEDLRLLYVALTRAKHRCYLVWGTFRGAESAALAYLHRAAPEGGAGAEASSSAARRAELGELALRAGGALEVLPVDPAPRGERFEAGSACPADLSPRPLRGRVPEALRISSFTALTSSTPEPERPDRDERASAPPEDGEPKASTFLGFPRGARAGQCVHEIFEGIDFGAPEGAAARALIAAKLAEHRFEPEWLGPVEAMVRDVLRTPLAEGSPFSLSGLRPEERAHELEFLFPCAGVTPGGLAEFFRTRTGPGFAPFGRRLGELGFTTANGYLKGFIDLVFQAEGRYYLLDWKSNYLGSDPRAYGPEALRSVMVEEYYLLQYHLYAVALDRYLRRRLPGYDHDVHFGGAYYLFVRGMRPELGRGAGVFHDRPPRRLIEELARFLAGELPEGSP